MRKPQINNRTSANYTNKGFLRTHKPTNFGIKAFQIPQYQFQCEITIHYHIHIRTHVYTREEPSNKIDGYPHID